MGLPIVMVDEVKCVFYNGKFVRVGTDEHRKIILEVNAREAGKIIPKKASFNQPDVPTSTNRHNSAQAAISRAHQQVFG